VVPLLGFFLGALSSDGRARPPARAEAEAGSRLALPLEIELTGRLSWFILLRWFAALLAVMAGVWSLRYNIGLPGMTIIAVGLTVALYNVFFRVILQPRLKNHVLNANLQIGADWLALMVLMHLSGGMHSPVLMFFFFHVIIAAIFIPGLGGYWHAAAATAIVGAVGWLESIGAISHVRPVWANLGPPGGFQLLVLVGSFGLAAFLSAFLTATIAEHLRQAEREQVDLQRELAGAVARLERANQDLIAMNEQRSRYTRTVTHQLRSPLSTIQAMLRVLLDGYGGTFDEKTRDVLRRVDARAVKLLETVSDLLNLAALDFQERPQAPQRVAIEPLVTGLVSRHRPAAETRKVAIESNIPEELTLNVAPEDIELALDNLISNAIKYTPSGGYVHINGRLAGDEVQISVEDTGIGIPPEAQERLFQEFYRAPNAKEFEPIGTGLGLVIVRRSAERWGGTISVTSAVNQGTTFTLCFPETTRPCEPLSAGDSSGASPSSSPSSGP